MKLESLAVLAVCCLALSGCSAQIVEASQAACESFGFLPGTDAYSQCVHQESTMRDSAVNRPALNAKSGLRRQQIPSASTAGGAVAGVPVLKSSYVSGTNRVCLYEQAGHEVYATVGAEAVCPQTLE